MMHNSNLLILLKNFRENKIILSEYLQIQGIFKEYFMVFIEYISIIFKLLRT